MSQSENGQKVNPIYSPSYPKHETLPKLQRKRRKNILIILISLFLVLLFTFLEFHYLDEPPISIFALININILLLILLLVLIFRNLLKLFLERKQREIGSSFRYKLIFAFVVISMLPTGFLVFIGSNLMAESIRNWFNPKIDEFLNESMDIARLSLASSDRLTYHFAELLSQKLSELNLQRPSDRDAIIALLNAKIREYNLSTVQIFDQTGMEICRLKTDELTEDVFIKANALEVQKILQGEKISKTKMLETGELLQSGLPLFSLNQPAHVSGVLLVSRLLDVPLAKKIHSVQRTFEAYNQQKQYIQPTQGLYISIFVMMAFTILFAAIWLGMYLAKQISIPISYLAQATHEVSRGNLNFKLDVVAYDEIGSLVKSFNEMTEQLRANRDLIDQTTSELKQTNLEIIRRRNQLETIIQNISAGILSVDSEGTITSINHAASNLLNLDEESSAGQFFSNVLSESYHAEIQELIAQALDGKHRGIQKEIQIQCNRKLSTCSISLAPLRDAENYMIGVVVVLDDLTQFLQIQRIAAWREVAKRLAHEIKNPLTPIQLNAERLQKKYINKSPDFSKIFMNATASIITEVNGLRILLDEFSLFARMPEATLQPVNIHEIIHQVQDLYIELREGISIEVHRDDQLPIMMLDRDQIKRVFVNLVDNSLEAMEGKGKITINTAYDSAQQIVSIKIADEGPGVPIQDRSKLFLPYYSTKRRGSGLGLAICNRIIADHEGSIRVLDNIPSGALFLIELPVIDFHR